MRLPWDDALGPLTAYNWPGNVKELENLIQRLVIITDENVIKIQDLPETMRFCASAGKCLNRTLAQFESEYRPQDAARKTQTALKIVYKRLQLHTAFSAFFGAGA